MRSATAPELVILANGIRQIDWRVKIANGSGTMKDYSTWVESIQTDEDIDQPVSSCTIHFRRDSGTTQSLSPFRADSPLNVLDDLVTYSPALDLNRHVTVEIPTTAAGVAPVSGDYKKIFDGSVDIVNFEHSPLSIQCRDLGATLVDRWVEDEKNYGTLVGRALEAVMQDVLDDNFGVGIVPLYVPTSPAFNIILYQQQMMSIMDALTALAQTRGADARYRWDDGLGAFRLTFIIPDRAKTTPDYTFNASSYIDITALNIDITGIKNAIKGTYRDSASPVGAIAHVTVTDGPSILKFGRQFMSMVEGDTSPINTSAEMTAMLNFALADLKDPKAIAEVETHFFWPAQLGDLFRFSPNGVHSDTNQDLAVVGIRHELSRGRHRTFFKLRGSPAGGYLNWLGRNGQIGSGTPGGALQLPVPLIEWLNTEVDDTVWKIEFDCMPGTGGGGTNLTWTIKSKIGQASEVLEDSGDGTDLPKNVDITRDAQFDKVCVFECSDVAMRLSAQLPFTVPSQRREVTAAGLPRRAFAYDDGSYAAVSTVNDGKTVLAKKVIGTGATPTLSSPQGFWDGTNTVTGTDTAGKITLDHTPAAAAQANGHQIKVTFASAYATVPTVLISPVGFGGDGLYHVGTVTTTDFWLDASAGVVLAGGVPAQQNVISYAVIG